MPVLNDKALLAEAERGFLRPFNPNHVSAASIDLTLGDTIKIESLDAINGPWVPISIEKPYEMIPGQFVLAHTVETITMPDDCCGQIVLRSSAARAGFEHANAGFVDSSFNGQLVLELKNNLQLRSLTLEKGMRLVQLIVFKLNDPAQTTYAKKGNYQGQQGVVTSNHNFASISS